MTYISSTSIFATLRQSVMQAQAGLAQAQTEISSGTLADMGATLGAQTGSTISMENEVDALAGYTTSNGIASTRLGATATTLTAMISAAQTISASLITASSAGGTTGGLQASASGGLQALLSGLNASANGQYVFAGINSGVAPLTTYSSTSTAKQAVDSSFAQTFGFSQTSAGASTISGSAMTAYLDGSFDSQFGDANWSANWSQASSTTISTGISPSQTTSTSVSANSTGFRQIAEAYTMLSEFTGAGMSADAQAAVVAKATTLINAGLAALNDTQAAVGTAQKTVSDANTTIAAQTIVLKGRVSSLTSVDTYTLSNQVTALQTQLQASYELTSRLQQLSLVNYLST